MTSTTKPIPLKCICEKHRKGACHMKVVSIIQEPFLMDNKLQGPMDTSYNVEWTKLVGVHLLTLEQWAGITFRIVLNIHTYINFI